VSRLLPPPHHFGLDEAYRFFELETLAYNFRFGERRIARSDLADQRPA
jgi:hypothetical protein